MTKILIKPAIRELLCQQCEQEYSCWSTHNDTWREVVFHNNIDVNFLCPNCFITLAEEKLGKQIWNIKLVSAEKSIAMQEALDSIPIYNRPHKFKAHESFYYLCDTCERDDDDLIHQTFEKVES